MGNGARKDMRKVGTLRVSRPHALPESHGKYYHRANNRDIYGAEKAIIDLRTL